MINYESAAVPKLAEQHVITAKITGGWCFYP
jgi:hypothetical protein